jgi:hypothetical protein
MKVYLVPIVRWVATSHLSVYLRDIPWMWPVCETIHFIGLAMVIGVAGFFDLRLLGFFNRVPISACKEFMPWAMVGFALNVISGLVFLTIFPAQYAYSQTWWFKVFFLFIAGANALVFETSLGERARTMEPGEASPVAFRAVGALSLVSWFFVLYFGRMLPYLGMAY